MAQRIPLTFIKLWSSLGALGLVLILWVSLIPQDEGMISIPHLDKALHFLAYAGAGWYFHQITLNRFPFKTSLGLFAYSALIEALQATTATRSAEALDLAFNLAGIALGFYLSLKATPNMVASVDAALLKARRRLF